MNEDRNPIILWKVLSELCNEDKEFADNLIIRLIGKVSGLVLSEIEKYGLSDNFELIEYLPHDEVILEQRKSHLLLLVVNDTPNAKGILTGKFFEYMSSGRPTLCIGPNDGDVADIIRETEAGSVFESKDGDDLEKYINESFEGKRAFKTNDFIKKYSRRELTKQLAKILDEL